MYSKKYVNPQIFVLQVTSGISILTTSSRGNAGYYEDGGEDGDDVPTPSRRNSIWD